MRKIRLEFKVKKSTVNVTKNRKKLYSDDETSANSEMNLKVSVVTVELLPVNLL